MAFIRLDWTFKDNKGCIITQHDVHNLEILGNFKANPRIQKNRQNGQEITIVADNENPSICSCQAAYRILLHSLRLNQPENLPLGILGKK